MTRLRDKLVEQALQDIEREVPLSREQEIVVVRTLASLADDSHRDYRLRDKYGDFIEGRAEW